MESNYVETPTLEEAKDITNYDFTMGKHVYFKGRMMSRNQIGEHLKVLRNVRIKPMEFMYSSLKLMLKNAIAHPTPWKKPHVYE